MAATSVSASAFLGNSTTCGEEHGMLVAPPRQVRVARPFRAPAVMKNLNEGKGLFAPIVVLARNVIGKKRFNQLRGKAIALHSQPTKTLSRIPAPPFFPRSRESAPDVRFGNRFRPRIPSLSLAKSRRDRLPTIGNSIPTAVASDVDSRDSDQEQLQKIEVGMEKVIYGCRFFVILAVWGSLVGSFLCFFKGCVFVIISFRDYFVERGKVISSLVEATDVYLLGTVMLVFGMGLYELFISNLDKAKFMYDGRSNLFGLFTLKGRPRWLEIKTVNELKTKLGHVIVMLLLIGLLDKSKKAAINSPFDLLCFSASVLLSSGCLFLLAKLTE